MNFLRSLYSGLIQTWELETCYKWLKNERKQNIIFSHMEDWKVNLFNVRNIPDFLPESDQLSISLSF